MLGHISTLANRFGTAAAITVLIGFPLGAGAQAGKPNLGAFAEYEAWKSRSGEMFARAVKVSRSDELVMGKDILVETPEQHRIVLAERFVPSHDLMVARLTDRTTGWSATLELQTGLENLGDAASWSIREHADAMRRIQERQLAPVYALSTPEVHLRAQDDEDDEGRGPMERLAAQLAASGTLDELPASVREALSFGATAFAKGSGSLGEDLVEVLRNAMSASGVETVSYTEVQWQVAPGPPERLEAGATSPARRLLEDFGPVPPIEKVEAIREEESAAGSG